MIVLNQIDLIVLVAAAFLTSMVSAILGMAGGISLLAVMMQYFPQTLLIPMHGVVQLFSNGFRSALNFKHIELRIFLPLVAGGLIGAIAARYVVFSIPQTLYSILLPLIILFFTWKPKAKNPIKFKAKFYVLGFFSTMMSILFGATGPLLAPFFLNENLSRFQIIGTKAATQFFGHSVKVILYFLLGVSLGPYWQVLALMVVAVLVGTYIGTKLLHKVPEKIFILLFKGLISLLCLRMLGKVFI